MQRQVVVIGGGIAGLAAAHRLAGTAPPGTAVTLLEGSPRLGGKLRASELAGLPLDEGAESLLARAPEAVGLARDVGLADELTYPATTAARLWVDGRLRPIPGRTLMGVPGDLGTLEQAGVLSPRGLARLALDLVLPQTPCGDDVSVGAFVGARLGREAVDRLVDPLLGGVYAGSADGLSLEATVPALAAAVRGERSLLLAARRLTRPGPAKGGAPVFAGIVGGVGRLGEAVAASLRSLGVDVRTNATVRELHSAPKGRFRLVVGSTREAQIVPADAVVVAVPARPASRLLREVAPRAAAELTGVDYASMALVTLVLDRSGLMELPGSGFLVPPGEGRLVKAATFLTTKWPWLADRVATGTEVVRCSVGRYGEEATLQRDDEELVRGCLADLAAAVGPSGRVAAARVTRWGGALPQYAVGHRARVARIRASVASRRGIAVCGAAYDGIGVPACIRSAAAAVDAVVADLRERGTMGP